MKSIEQIRSQLDVLETAWRSEVDHLQAENDRLAEKASTLEAEIDLRNVYADALHEAICEGRLDDAIELLNAMTGGNYRSLDEQRNLFPDRVPA